MWPFLTLFRRASQGSCPTVRHTVEAVMAEFGNTLFSIPSARVLHSALKKKKYVEDFEVQLLLLKYSLEFEHACSRNEQPCGQERCD